MPLYEYQCQRCGHRFEVLQKMSAPPLEACPACGEGPVVKLLSPPAIQFKGTGWYITDYARKDQQKAKPADTPKADDPASTKEKPADAKPAGESSSSPPSTKDTGS